MKRILLLLLALLPFSLMAESISQDQARELAGQFLQASGFNATRSSALELVWDGLDTQTRSLNDKALCYVFNLSSEKGFVMVSADDCLTPILGYSFENSFDGENVPIALKTWMKDIERQRNIASQLNLQPNSKNKVQGGAKNYVTKMETALWGQAEPYNLQCPKDASAGDKHSVTGCLATAGSIVYKYNRWPESGVGTTDAYTCEISKIPVAARDLNHTYNWDNMLMDYSNGKGTTEQRDEVARLMADLGAAFHLDYSYAGTMGNIDELTKYSPTKFKYSRNINFIFGANYSQNSWIDIIKTELNAKRLVLYRGADINESNGGHFFILDGYTEDDFYHVNWGWDGQGNGDFKLNALTPLPNYDYSYGHCAIVNFKKAEAGETYACPELRFFTYIDKGQVEPSGLACNETAFMVNKTFEITIKGLGNTGPAPYDFGKGNVNIVVIDKSGKVKYTLEENIINLGSGDKLLPAGYSFRPINKQVTLKQKIEKGDGIALIYKNYDTGTFLMLEGNTEKGCKNVINIGENIISLDYTPITFNRETKELIIEELNPKIDFEFRDSAGKNRSDLCTRNEDKVVINVKDLGKGMTSLTFKYDGNQKEVLIKL